MIEVGGVALSPYFQNGQLADVEFYDFTLEGPSDVNKVDLT